jgi:selT/selW/selH-like putative selenoprotein
VVGILYCITCDYQARALRAAAALHEALGIDAVLIRGHSGRFEIEVDGRVVLAKGPAGFPTEQEVVDAVARALTSPLDVARG